MSFVEAQRRVDRIRSSPRGLGNAVSRPVKRPREHARETLETRWRLCSHLGSDADGVVKRVRDSCRHRVVSASWTCLRVLSRTLSVSFPVSDCMKTRWTVRCETPPESSLGSHSRGWRNSTQESLCETRCGYLNNPAGNKERPNKMIREYGRATKVSARRRVIRASRVAREATHDAWTMSHRYERGHRGARRPCRGRARRLDRRSLVF